MHLQRVLDLGCGDGDSWKNLGSNVEDWAVLGIDVAWQRVALANRRYGDRGWRYLVGRGESLPLKDCSVNGVICRGALPYMSIPKALEELHRVLVPDGWLRASLHPPGFTWSELRKSFPSLRASVYRGFVILNGWYFHMTGRVMRLGSSTESCQTEKGIETALLRAGFVEVKFGYPDIRFVVEARRSAAVGVREPVVAQIGRSIE